ncbi:MAG TPA: SDR family oxidoreductase [Dehalococcoidia bacterium]|nr:SDR family oxidoreductase [Dehalococcoidia bacterium]
MTLEGRVALVTGAAGRGMGRSIALTLARDGADVVVNYRRSAAAADDVARAIGAMGRRALAHQADVSDPDQVAAMFERAASEVGPVDIVVNSAGGPWKPRDITEIEPETLRAVLAREVEATYYLLRAALPGMRERGWGRFVSIGGHMADEWRFGPPEAPLDYPLGKAARHWLTRTIAPREAAHGITINAVAPGPTAHIDGLEAARRQLEGRDEPTAGNRPQDIAEVVAFLCSEAAARLTGAVIPLPGDRPV